MPICYWGDKKVALTPEQVDENFRFLESLCQDLSQKLALVQAQLEQKTYNTFYGDYHQGTLRLTLGQHTVSIPLPMPSMAGRGMWKTDTSYGKNDWVHYQGIVYCCGQEHTSHTVEDLHDDSLWQKMFFVPEAVRVRGLWQADTNFEVGDWVQLHYHLLRCHTAHRSGTVIDKKYWDMVFALQSE